MPRYVRITLVDGSIIVVRDSTSAAKMAKRLEKVGYFETIQMESADDEGTPVVIMRASVAMLSPYTLPYSITGAVRITSVPSKTRN